MDKHSRQQFHASGARRPGAKPLTIAESNARQLGAEYFELALSYRDANDVPNAVSCCLEGIAVTDGISRPLVVRDQLMDLVDYLDPTHELRSRIKSAAHKPAEATTRPLTNPQHSAPHARSTFLERLVSCHQLLDYPSEYRRFNQTYEDALACARSGDPACEFYIVQYRSARGSSANDLYFSFVPAAMISASGPYYLTDICAVVRHPPCVDISPSTPKATVPSKSRAGLVQHYIRHSRVSFALQPGDDSVLGNPNQYT